MFSELKRLRPPACGPSDHHVIVAWLSRQLICSESVVFRILVERRGDYIIVSQQFAGIKKTCHGLVVKTGIDARGSRGRVYRRRVYGRCRVWRDVEPAGTREVRLVFVWNLCVTWETVWRHGSSTGGSRRPWPCPSPSFYPVNFGSSRQSVRYRVACWRDRRSTSLKDTFWGVYLFLLFVYFVISVVILISNGFSSSNFRCLFF